MLTTDAPAPRAWLVALWTGLSYALVGWLTVQLAIPPSHATPAFPSAGIALAAMLTLGRPAFLGVWAGASLLNLTVALGAGTPVALAMPMAAVIGLGASVQAAIAVWVVRKRAALPDGLTEPLQLVRFFALAGPLACVVSASVGTLAYLSMGSLPLDEAFSNWGTWWLGDTLGVLVGAPIALAVIGRPRVEWQGRRWVVAAPMILALVLVAASTRWVDGVNNERVHAAFQRDAAGLADRLQGHLVGPQRALLALHTLYTAAGPINLQQFRMAAQEWLRQPLYLQAMGYSESVPRSALAAFEASVRAEGVAPDYRVFDRTDAGAVQASDTVLAIRYIEPLAGNARALGVNTLSIAAAREAIQRAIASGDMAATSGFRLTQLENDETGIVMYEPLYHGSPDTAVARRAAFAGVVFVTLRLDALAASLFGDTPDHLSWCLLERAPLAGRPRAAGAEGCEARPARAFSYLRTIELGGRTFDFRVDAEPVATAGLSQGGSGLFAVIGLIGAFMLGTLLLTLSGRQRRIEGAVEIRTRELRRAAQALRDSEERLRNIVDHVPIGVLYADPQGRLREANPALQSMLGADAQQLPGSRLIDTIDPLDRDRAGEWLQQLAAGDRAVVRERLRLLRRDGLPVWVQLGLSAQLDSDGKVRRLVGVAEDISERLRLETSERGREQAEHASRAKSDFVSRMSHELRTPLNAMLGFAQLLARDSQTPLTEHQQRWASQIQDAGWHLLNLINDTLDLSMIEAGTLRLTPTPLDPAALLASTMPMVIAAAERRSVTLSPPTVETGVGEVTGDETRVRQILTNLLSNAVKYNLPDGRVDVHVRRLPASGEIEFSVRDTGHGLSARQAESLFEPFNRLGRERGKIEGTGIGLVISRRLAELMGGSLTLGQTAGPGATFVLRLPAAEGPRQEPTSTLSDPLEVNTYRARIVHYVEDNETNVLLMRGMLSQRPQIELTVSTLGLDALPALRARRPDLILLDMHLPDIDGINLLQHLKASDEMAAIPVLVLSADATRERIERALSLGAAGYLCKPLDLQELLRTVDGLLAQVDTRWG